jgi:hypothetical protein
MPRLRNHFWMHITTTSLLLRHAATACLLSLLAACGGGNSGNSNTPGTPPPVGAPPGGPPPSSTDTTPDTFAFTAARDAAPGALIVSAPVTVSGIDAPAALGVSGGEVSIGGATFTAQAGVVRAGDVVRVRVAAPPVAGGRATATLTIGGVSASFDVFAADGPDRPAATYRVGPCPAGSVCPGTALNSLNDAASRVKAGDVVDVYASDTPYPAVRFERAGTADKPIRIQGVAVNGRRPLIRGGVNPATGYAVHFLNSHHMVFDNFEVSNGVDRLAGGTLDKSLYSAHQCVRHEAHDITLARSKVFACANNGVFGTDEGSGSLTLDRVEITRSGCVQPPMQCGNNKHPLYVATDGKAYPGAVLRIVDSYVHGNVAGEGLKMRAGRGEIYHNWIEVTGPHEYRALALYGFDIDDQQASLAEPIHHDVMGNVLIVDATTSPANAVVRLGSDRDASDNHANTHGRARFVNNTALVNGGFAAGGDATPVLWFFGRPEGVMAFNNLVVTPGGGAVNFMKEASGDGKLRWAAADAQARVMASHNVLPPGSRVLTLRTGTGFGMNDAAPAGYAWSNWISASNPFASLTAVRAPDAAALRLPGASGLRGAGTTATNPARHPFEPDPSRGFALPGVAALPAREAVEPGAPQRGAPRSDSAAPTPGAYP